MSTHAHTHTHVHTHTHTHTNTHTNTHTHTHTHTYTHTHTPIQLPAKLLDYYVRSNNSNIDHTHTHTYIHTQMFTGRWYEFARATWRVPPGLRGWAAAHNAYPHFRTVLVTLYDIIAHQFMSHGTNIHRVMLQQTTHTLISERHLSNCDVTVYCIQSVVSSFSNLNRWSSFLGLFYHVPLKKDKEIEIGDLDSITPQMQ